MVGGNGPNVTWRLAARYADELNLDGMTPAEVAEALPVIRARCEEIGRDPATLAVSVHLWGEDMVAGGPERVDRLAAYRELGVEPGHDARPGVNTLGRGPRVARRGRALGRDRDGMTPWPT